jgi:ribonucleoside-diphosphate reductase alpha chain
VISERTVDARAALAVPLAHPRSVHLKPRTPSSGIEPPANRTPPAAPTTPDGGNGHANGNGGSQRSVTVPTPTGTSVAERIRLARQKGYEGDPCSKCGQLTLVRSGACMRCDSCGETSGCG